MNILATVCGYLICGFVGILGLLIIWRILDGTIDLSRLISEPNGDASMARFQFLVFTFVIALSLFLVVVGQRPPTLPAVIPGGILALLGISGSSYLVSKGIQFSSPAGVEDRALEVIIKPMSPCVPYGGKQQFSADVPRQPSAQIKWEVIAGPGTIDATTGLYSAPATRTFAAQPGGPQVREHATIRASVEGDDAYDLAVLSLA